LATESPSPAEELEQRTRQLADKSARDPLTGLLNRDGIHQWLQSVIPAIRPDSEQLAVAFIDVDRFKAIHDSYGHLAGDQVLQKFAASLSTVGRTGDPGRLGGDEFIVAALLPATDASIGTWTCRLQTAATVGHHYTRVGASVGVASITSSATSPALALHLADLAMYRIKKGHLLQAAR
jgi:diguanylate cyclase (GGDEF)-like protein